ncbi:MAG: undecaprenyl-diphosphate phosphatase [Candidatus Omnitrophica bacterium]|nr:undecaprenyl-diphosphate phosphatase [Candidatus Omnitrophota bacterium]MBU4457842.1 undecaprenyl-diphosphate phosphatase [Candidatus Omnitrophota bacterium]
MTFVEAIISGIVQGVTEFLPVSSSGHLVIFHRLIGLKEPQLLFDIFLHVGTLAAIFIVFWHDIVEIFSSRKKSGLYIVLGTIVTGIFVLIFGKSIEAVFVKPWLVGIMLVITGLWLILARFIRFSTGSITGGKAMIIGLAQAIAALPGISRSGVTISTGLFLGMSPEAAARFSFLLSIPAIIGAFLFKIRGADLAGLSINYFIGFVISCIVGVFSLKLLLKVLHRNKFHFFGIYCIVVGLFVWMAL